MSVVGPSSVLAYTQTSRATKIQHVIRITETAGGRTYAHPPLTDDSGFLHQSALYTSVAMPRCTEPMTVDARTEHSAESITFARQLALSHGNGSCSPPSPCPSDKTSPISYNCTGGGGSGGTTTVTCYTVTTEYYWYYPDTDTYEYRYTETNTWCESST
ncbi:hypothetical protein [Longimicrobium sp.]|uniref:hypothetical protein n=1 Tax=Longimicrobium sp. TaxID=2029185 RepID=UPI002E300900|nr:hypothetical protein [Longimicrobium sp.]HEX6042822.1 hypothetical protein [Longimicrobium sp.]